MREELTNSSRWTEKMKRPCGVPERSVYHVNGRLCKSVQDGKEEL